MSRTAKTEARYHSACDIAHRWFAYFEGETEDVISHSSIFSEDIMLVHAGTHLLAKGKSEIIQWLNNLPYEKGSHFIRHIDVKPLENDQAEVNMDISYQAIGKDGTVGGALSKYQTLVTYDNENNAVFTFIQKTPLMPNPDKVFHDSFADNRLRSFINHLFYLMLTPNADIRSLFSSAPESYSLNRVLSLPESSNISDILLISSDPESLSFLIQFSLSTTIYELSLSLNEAPGRYISIKHAELLEKVG
ncbi:hypothetical protein [Tatumella citrea]|uniref:SnoaL-like domain-containing protein n=1 Tax=Tatumella citrea TaxID=53336 RepID=A0A1Y0LN08_TATCI|nr:hypothetical protein [Tatumella citrea]ARU95355.1 hypothetical protein A7K98_17385 [Tatumella citrea]ARU99396.1 hypothetical protein A7K99_17370 [Tatumella citrea]